jgi:hypothetical protein
MRRCRSTRRRYRRPTSAGSAHSCAAAYGRSRRQPACTLTVSPLAPLALSTYRTRSTLQNLNYFCADLYAQIL